MKLRDLISKLERMPLSTLDLEVLMDNGKKQAVDFLVDAVREDDEITGFIIVEDKQLRLPFGDEPR